MRTDPSKFPLIPAYAGTQTCFQARKAAVAVANLDPRMRGDEREFGTPTGPYAAFCSDLVIMATAPSLSVCSMAATSRAMRSSADS